MFEYKRKTNVHRNKYGQKQKKEAVPQKQYARPPVYAAFPSHSKTIQRLVGFEAELNVPVIEKPASKVTYETLRKKFFKPDTAVEAFLFKADQPYNTPCGGHLLDFELKTDHNFLSRKHNLIIEKLRELNYLDNSVPDIGCSILEYVTPPEDETIPGLMEKHLDRMTAHMEGLLSRIGDEMTPIEFSDYYTGIPLESLKHWITWEDQETILPYLNGYKNEIKTATVYLQATAGIIPSSIGKLHENHTQQPVAYATDVLFATIRDAYEKVISDISNQEYVNGLREEGILDMFNGVLYLICAYMIGNAFYQTTAVTTCAKNSIPFLVKLRDMSDIITKAAPALAAHRPEHALADLITSSITPYANPDALVARINNSEVRVQRRSPFIGSNFVRNILLGNAGQELSLSGNSFPEPDPMRNPDRNQKGVQLEYRYIHRGNPKFQVHEFKSKAMEIVEEVRELNSR